VITVGVVAATLAVRAGLRALLQSGPEAKLTVVWEANSLPDPESLPAGLDVLLITAEVFVLMDLRRLLASRPGELALLVLSNEAETAQPLPNLPLRAWGVLSLDASGEELHAALQALHEGLLVGAPALLRPTLTRLLAGDGREGEPLIEALTERESQVLQLLAYGLANKQIAANLTISEHTVKFHVSSIYTKLGVASRTEAVRIGVQQGLIVL